MPERRRLEIVAHQVEDVTRYSGAVTSAKVKQYTLLRSDFKRGEVAGGQRGLQGIQGAQEHPGREGRS